MVIALASALRKSLRAGSRRGDLVESAMPGRTMKRAGTLLTGCAGCRSRSVSGFFHALGDLIRMLDELLLVGHLARQLCEVGFDSRAVGRLLCARQIALGIGEALTQCLEYALRRSPPAQMAAHASERPLVVAGAIYALP
jgi:hypothetical protein